MESFAASGLSNCLVRNRSSIVSAATLESIYRRLSPVMETSRSRTRGKDCFDEKFSNARTGRFLNVPNSIACLLPKITRFTKRKKRVQLQRRPGTGAVSVSGTKSAFLSGAFNQTTCKRRLRLARIAKVCVPNTRLSRETLLT